MKLLIVEDGPKVGEYLKQGLSEAGYVVDLVGDGLAGMRAATIGDYDLVVLDVTLPGLDGWQVLQAIRRAGKRMPVLFLTARNGTEDRAKAMELGADDYLAKPVAFCELLARIRELLRRQPGTEASILMTADLELDLLRKRALRAKHRIELTPKEFALLELLMRHQGEVLSRSLIASQVWDMNFDSDAHVIDAAVWRLRAKVDGDFEPKLIHTVRGMGYVLDAPQHA